MTGSSTDFQQSKKSDQPPSCTQGSHQRSRVQSESYGVKTTRHSAPVSTQQQVPTVQVVQETSSCLSFSSPKKWLGLFRYWSKVSGLCSSEQVRVLQTENRQDEFSDSSVEQKCYSTEVSLAQMPECSTSLLPERLYPRGNVHSRRVVGRHNLVSKFQCVRSK